MRGGLDVGRFRLLPVEDPPLEQALHFAAQLIARVAVGQHRDGESAGGGEDQAGAVPGVGAAVVDERARFGEPDLPTNRLVDNIDRAEVRQGGGSSKAWVTQRSERSG